MSEPPGIDIISPGPGVSRRDVLRADVAIVGSGAGAGAVGGELRRRGRSVIMIEAGQPLAGDRPGAHIRNAFPAEDQLETHYGPRVWDSLVPFGFGAQKFPGMRGAQSIHSVGGMLAYWSHFCVIPDAETEAEPAIPAAELRPLWQRAMGLLWANTDIEAAGLRQHRILEAVRKGFPDLPAPRDVQPLPAAMRRTPAGLVEFAGLDALLLPGEDDASGQRAGQVTILAAHPARSVEFAGDRAVAVLAAARGSSRVVRVEADVVVVAAGALGTPQLLHASGVRPPALGRYLTDHTQLVSRVKLRDDLLADVPADDPAFSVWIPVSRARPMHTQISRGWITSSPILAGLPARLTADIGQFTGVDPDPENRILFHPHQHDGFGLPQLDIRFRLSAADRDRAAAMFADHYRVAESIADFGYAVEASLMAPGTSLHLMGTYRMGSRDDGTSVADSFGRVWGHSNLYVAGNGLISTRNAGNPTVATVALGLRTADHILAAHLAPTTSAARGAHA